MTLLTVTIAGVDRTGYVETETLIVRNTGYGGIAVADFELLDEAGTLAVASEEIVRITDAGGEVFEGPIRTLTKRSLNDKTTGRRYSVHCQDYNGLLGDDVVTAGVRKTVESDKQRIEWLVSTFGTKGVTAGANVSTIVASMPEQDFTGMTLEEAIGEVETITGGLHFTDFDKDLHSFDPAIGEGDAAPFGLSDAPNGTTTFGYRDLAIDEDSVGAKDAVYVIGDGIAGWYPGTPGASDRTGVLEDSEITDQSTLDAAGAAYLAQNAEQTRGRLTTYKAGLRAGMDVQITNAAYGLSAVTYRVQRVETRMEGDESGVYDVAFGDVPVTLAGAFGGSRSLASQAHARAQATARTVADLSVAGANLLRNGSFESGSGGTWHVGPHWTFGYNPEAPDDALHGQNVARLTMTGSVASSGELTNI